MTIERSSLAVVEEVFRVVNEEHIRSWLSVSDPMFQPTLEFAVSRFREGVQLLSVFRDHFPNERRQTGRLLEIGGGNGGMVLPFAVSGGYECHSLDLFVHHDVRKVLQATASELSIAVGRGEELPYADSSFDLILYIETIEHVQAAHRVGEELARVLAPGGLCLITTPPRLRYLLRPDPHYNVRFLLLLPNPVQRWLVERVFRRGTRYEVSHIYWSLWGVLRHLPGMRLRRVFTDSPSRLLGHFNWSLIVAEKPPDS